MRKSGARFLLTGDGFPPKCGHNDFDNNQGTCLGFFINAKGPEASHLWVADGSYKYIHYDGETKRLLYDIIQIAVINIPTHSVFIEHGYLQDARVRC